MTMIIFKGAQWWNAQISTIGDDRTPLIIINNFFRQPDILLEDAAQKSFTANARYYPGVRAPVPQAYFTPLINALSDVLANVFGYQKGVDLQECNYSLVTTSGRDLNMVQRLPHIDGGNDRKVSLLHYLCGAEHGGTAFYKQCSTGFESVPNYRFEKYKTAVEADHIAIGAPAATYFNESDERFKKIKHVDAKYNRAILYFGTQLHSVIIGDSPLTNSVKTGRLTINTFFSPL